MALPAIPELQLVLKVAKEFIRLGQIVKVFPADAFLVMELLQCKERSPRTQPSFLTAINSLQALHQKLNIPDTAAVEFDVNRPFCRDTRRSPLASLVDPLSCLERCLDSRKVHVWTVDKGRNRVGKLAGQLRIASRMAGLNHRLQLPVLRHLRVVLDRPWQPHCQLTLVALRTQTKINAKHLSFLCAPGQQLRSLLGKTNEVLTV